MASVRGCLLAALHSGTLLTLSAAAPYPAIDRSAEFCCSHDGADGLLQVLQNPGSGYAATADKPVYPECQLLALLEDERKAICTSANTSASGASVRDLLQDSTDAQKRIAAGTPLVGSILEPGTCQGLQVTANAAPVGIVRYWSWHTFPDHTSEYCGGPNMEIANLSDVPIYLDMRLRCPAGPKGGLGVRARWLMGADKRDHTLCEDVDALLNANITAEDWMQQEDLPRWTCYDIPEGPTGAPWYRLLLTSIGDTPCHEPTSPTPAPEHELSGSARISVVLGSSAVAAVVALSSAISTALF